MQLAKEITYFLLRVVSGFLFIQSGGLILFGWFGGMPGGAKVTLLSQNRNRRHPGVFWRHLDPGRPLHAARCFYSLGNDGCCVLAISLLAEWWLAYAEPGDAGRLALLHLSLHGRERWRRLEP